MRAFLTGLLRVLGPALFDGIEKLYRSWSRDRALKKLGYKEAVEKSNEKKSKVLKKIGKKRAAIRSNPDAADKLQHKFTLKKKAEVQSSPLVCAQGLFPPIFPTDEDWDLMSRELYWQIQDHNAVFD